MIPITYLIFARTPRLGAVKTRLAATLGDAQTLRLYEAMLTDTLHTIRARKPATVLLFAYPPDSTAELAAWVEARQLAFPELRILPQYGATLGEQMQCAFQIAEQEHLLPAIILGTDSPTLPQHIWREAENALQVRNTAVLGRADDGGFYAMGLQKSDATFFFGGDYSNATVFSRTEHALSLVFDHIHLLPVWTDVDDAESLQTVVRKASDRNEVENYETVRVCEELGIFTIQRNK
jgi:rSAM/selenodomain-associated transferase 1